MKTIISLFVILMAGTTQAETKTVNFVDLNRYLGTWYEIASIPQIFSKGCTCSKAQYSLRDDGDLNVINSCNKGSVTGKLKTVEGTAEVVDKKTNAKLKVTFFWPFSGDYWVIGLDADYRYAVVSNDDGSSLWILSRTPILDKELIAKAVATAEEKGGDIGKLKYTEQEDCKHSN